MNSLVLYTSDRSYTSTLVACTFDRLKRIAVEFAVFTMVASPFAVGSGAATSQTSGFSFAPAVTYNSGGYATYSVAVADLNGDSKPDIVVVNSCGTDKSCAYTSTVGVLLGNGDGTFKNAVTFDSGLYDLHSVAISDVNGDGNPDILVVSPNRSTGNNVNPHSTVGVFIGNGDGTFRPIVTYDSGGVYAIPIAVADMNRDGKADIVVGEGNCFWGGCNGTPYVSVLLGNGDGTFQTAVLSPNAVPGSNGFFYCQGNCTDTAVAIGDLNGDGNPDVAVVVAGLDVSSLIGLGDGTLSVLPYVYTTGTSVAIADMDGDGKGDLVATLECPPTPSGCVEVLPGNGDGTFQSAVGSYSSGGVRVYSVAAGDVNGDGKPDIVATNAEQAGNPDVGSVGVLQANGDGTFQPVVTYASGGFTAQTTVIADVNGDGKPDLVVANSCLDNTCTSGGAVGVLLNTSAPAGTTATALVSSLNPSMFGQSVTFTATVTTSGLKMPTGLVRFMEGSTTLGTGALNGSGVVAFTTSSLIAGQHSVTAIYGGDASNAASTSAVFSQTVNTPDFTLSSSPGTAAVSAGSSAAFVVKVEPQGSFSNPITFSCTGVPALARCEFSPSTVTTDANVTTSNLTIATAGRTASNALPRSGRPSSPLFAICFVLPAMVLVGAGLYRPRRTSVLNFSFVWLLAGSLGLLAACGGGSAGSSGGGGSAGAGGTPAGSYTITVVGAAGSVRHTTTVTLTVQ